MSGASNSFAIPREQFLARRFLTVRSNSSPQKVSRTDVQGFFFFWARNALFHALRALEVPTSARVLVPAYLCRAAVEPLEAYGARVDFYRIRRNCTADLDEIESKIRPDTRVVLAVHYFGFPQDTLALRNLCDARNLFLFEDCAHVLRGEIAGQPLGSLGDASVFSYRKFLPMFDGAELLLRDAKRKVPISNSMERSRFSSHAAKHIVGQALDLSSSGAAKLAVREINLVRNRHPEPRLPSEPPTTPSIVDNNSASFDPAIVNQPITPASRWVLQHSDVAAVVARRRENFQFLHEHLQDVPGITPLFRSLVEGVCPWVYPVFFVDVPDAHLLLRAAGIPAVTWGGVRPRNVSPIQFPDADFLYDNLLFLPIHQNLSSAQLSLMAETVKRVRAQIDRPVRENVPVAS